MSIKSVGKSIIAKVLSFVCFRKIDMTSEEARRILTSVSEKPDGTNIAHNNIDIRYDLQVIIPAYNVERYISKCLESVIPLFNRGYKVLVQVIDDGSSDRTGEIIDSFKSKVEGESLSIIHQENMGLSGARNTALKKIQGEYVMLLDSDDYLPDNFNLKRLMETAKNYDILQGYIQLVDTDNNQIGHLTPDHLYGYPWGKLYHNKIFKDFLFPEKYWYEDTPFTFIFGGMNLKTGVLDEDIYCYRQNPGGISQQAIGKPKAIDTYWITELCLEEFPAFGVEYDQRAYECLMYQIITNRKRLGGLSLDVRKAAFVLTCDLIDKYFKGFHSKIFPMMSRAFSKRQYKKFEYMFISDMFS